MAARPAARSDPKIKSQPASSAWVQQFLLFALFFAGLMLLHAPLLRLPYFWDEAGYYIPAARDLFLTGTLIPQSTPSNAHPPLVMAWLALAWRVFGYSTLVTRTAMLAVSAFSLLGLFRLSRIAANLPVAWATTALVALYPVYFTQSSMAQVDLPAAGFTFWALAAYIEDHTAANRRTPSVEASAVVLAGGVGERDCDPGSAGAVCVGAARLFHSAAWKENRWKKVDGKKFFLLWTDARARFICCCRSCRWRAGTPTITRRRASCWAIPNSFATTLPLRSILCASRLLWE